MRPSSPLAPPRLRTIIFSAVACCLLTPVVYAQSSASSLDQRVPGSGETVDVWQQRQERSGSFGTQWASFAIVQQSWVTKWQKARGRLLAHVDRCHLDIRSSNRDTLLPVTLQCYRGQLKLEQDSLTNERAIINQWPGIPAASKKAMLGATDALLSALQPVVDAIDAKVFTSLDAFKNVRANLLEQYRKPYWLASARFRADASLTWLDHLLLTLHALEQDGTLEHAQQEKILSALQCYETAESLLTAARDAETLEESHKNFTLALTTFPPCAALLREAQALQQAASSSSPARP